MERPRWLLRAAVAFQQAARSAECDLLAVDAVNFAEESEVLKEHVAMNVGTGCSVATYASMVGNPGEPLLWELLDRALAHRPRGKVWDFVDLDCQGCELPVARVELPALATR
eukprot:5715962-Amphidinium_carterae.1